MASRAPDRRTVCGLLFPFGLGMVIATGAELFTGNCLITISLLDGRCSWRGMLRNWSIVYLSNFAGALLVAAAAPGSVSSTTPAGSWPCSQ